MSGGFNPLSMFNPATLLGTALGGPLGGIITQALQQVVSSVVQDVIQKAGEMLNVPQPFIDAAQGAFAGSIGDYAGAQTNLQDAIGGLSGALGQSGAQAGEFQRNLGEQLQSFIEDSARQITQKAKDESHGRSGAAAGAQGGSVLMKIALAIGSALDDKVNRMADISDQIGEFGSIDKDNMAQYNSMSAEMNALGQEIKIVSEALNNALKSIGDSASSLARKQ